MLLKSSLEHTFYTYYSRAPHEYTLIISVGHWVRNIRHGRSLIIIIILLSCNNDYDNNNNDGTTVHIRGNNGNKHYNGQIKRHTTLCIGIIIVRNNNIYFPLETFAKHTLDSRAAVP